MKAAGLDSSEATAKVKEWQGRQQEFLSKTGFGRQYGREMTAGFGSKQAAKAFSEATSIEKEANRIFSLGDTETNVKMYLKEKQTIDMLASHGVKYIQRISVDEIIVDAGKPRITQMRRHAIDNLLGKEDRKGMTIEQAQFFVDNVKLTVYQSSRESLKFLVQDGYAVLNFQNELVTAVPQKWRKKYDRFIGGNDQ